MNEPEENDAIRQTLRQAMPDDLPPMVAERMQNRLAAFHRKLDMESATPRFSPIRSLFQKRLVRWATAAITTAALAVAILLIPKPWRPAESSAWAQVVEAVAKKPWLHFVATYEDGTKMEAWFSARREVLAGRLIKAGSRFEVGGDREGRGVIDMSRNTRDWYDPEKKLIVRATNDPFREEADPFLAIFSAFLSGNLKQTIGTGKIQLVPEQQRVVTEGAKRWIEHRFIVRDRSIVRGKDEELYKQEWILLVDPDTQLPFRWEQATRLASDPAKGHVTIRNEIDYPATGPEDMYALGVPKTAKIVVRTLALNVEQLATEIVSPKHWANNKFSALVIESRQDQAWWQGLSINRVWKDGLCWKIDHSMGPVTEPFDKPPPEGTDQAEWWRQKAKKRPFTPESLCDGKWYWSYHTKTRSPTPKDTAAGWPENTMVIVSTEKRKSPGFPVEKDHFRQGEGIGVGHPSDPWNDLKLLPGMEASVNPKPKSGPPNTLLLEVRNPGWKLYEPDPRRNPQLWRFWIDPARDYLVMRDEELITREGKETIISGFAIEAVLQDAQGRWYPTVIRRLKCSTFIGTDKWEDEFLRFYYDFTTPIPDSVFKAD
jgi:hypothetical protein